MRRVAHAAQRFDAPVEVALHQVGAADVELRPPAVREPVDARVLEEPADDGADANALADAGHAGLQAADAADDQVDLDAGLRRAVERADRSAGSVTALFLTMTCAGRPCARVLDLALEQREKPRAQAHRRDEQLPVFLALRVARSGS